MRATARPADEAEDDRVEPDGLMRLADDGCPWAGDPFRRWLSPAGVAAALASVEKLAWHLAHKLARSDGRDGPSDPDLVEDLAAAARLGFVRAAREYDPGRGTRFATYCYQAGWREAAAFLTAHSARGLKVPIRHPVAKPAVVSLDAGVAGTDGERDPVAVFLGREDPPPGPDFPADFWDRVLGALVGDRERAVALGRFRDGLTLAEVGERLGIKPERARQIEYRLLRRLRENAALADDLRGMLP